MSELGFAKWMVRVDQSVIALIGVSVYDLADFNSRDLYEDGVSPMEAAKSAIRADDTGFDVLLEDDFDAEDELDY